MPHITVDGCNTERQISEIKIHVNMNFSRIAWANQAKCEQRIEEFKEKLEALLSEYFDPNEISSDDYSNHEWNTRMHNY